MTDQSRKEAAQSQFKTPRKADDGKKAMAEYEAQAIALRAKTERLRALRLAHEAAQQAAEGAPAGAGAGLTAATAKRNAGGGAKPRFSNKSAAKTRAGKSKESAGTLSDWLDAQEASGRRS